MSLLNDFGGRANLLQACARITASILNDIVLRASAQELKDRYQASRWHVQQRHYDKAAEGFEALLAEYDDHMDQFKAISLTKARLEEDARFARSVGHTSDGHPTP